MHKLAIVGLTPDELYWLRVLAGLLRHPDPVVPELARQALRYVQTAAGESGRTAAARG